MHKLKARTAGAQGNQPPKRSHSVELWPGLGGAFPKGWIQSSPAPGPLGSSSSVALQESGALAGIPGWLRLSSFSLHIWGRHFLLPGACGSGFHPDGKSHPGAPQRRAYHGNSTGRPPDTGASGHWQALPGPGPQPCQLGGEGTEGAPAGHSISGTEQCSHLHAKQRVAECEHISVGVCAFRRVCLQKDSEVAAPALCPLNPSEPQFPWLCPS